MLIILIHIFIASTLIAQVDYTFKPVTVTASRLSRSLAADTRSLTVLTQTQIKNLPASSIADILRLSGVDIGRRGIGAQNDFSLRGGNFEQVLILIDGVRINDPQTGHFNSDLPVSLQDIERIEILRGQASSLFGPEGFGGVIHLHTRSGNQTVSQAMVQGGSFGHVGAWFSQTLRLGNWRHGLSISREKSDGYRRETGLDAGTARLNSTYQNEQLYASASVNLGKRDFGANGFYAPYPSHETTETLLGQGLIAIRLTPDLKMQTRLFSRIHEDDFILDADRPAWYRNQHRSRSTGAEMQMNWNPGKSTQVAWGIEGNRESLLSARLGDHIRIRYALFGESAYRSRSGWTFNGGLRLDQLGGSGLFFNPSIGVAKVLPSQWTWRLAAGRAFRQPSFTEYYYDSPANRGDINLQAESAWSVESGLRRSWSAVHLDGCLFVRQESNPIDWLLISPGVWQASNLPNRTLRGGSLDLSIQKAPVTFQTRFDVFFLDQTAELKDSKYGMNTTRYRFLTSLGVSLPLHLQANLSFSHRERLFADPLSLLDLGIFWSRNKWRVELDFSNLLNQKIEEIPGVPLPGRYFLVSVYTR